MDVGRDGGDWWCTWVQVSGVICRGGGGSCMWCVVWQGASGVSWEWVWCAARAWCGAPWQLKSEHTEICQGPCWVAQTGHHCSSPDGRWWKSEWGSLLMSRKVMAGVLKCCVGGFGDALGVGAEWDDGVQDDAQVLHFWWGGGGTAIYNQGKNCSVCYRQPEAASSGGQTWACSTCWSHHWVLSTDCQKQWLFGCFDLVFRQWAIQRTIEKIQDVLVFLLLSLHYCKNKT